MRPGRARNAASILMWGWLLPVLPAAAAETTLVPVGANWKYLDNGSNQGTAWRAAGFNDSGWSSGPAQLGYGDGDEATVVSYGPNSTNKYITTYFRNAFTVADASAFGSATLRLLRDDGAVVYLNGTEVFRSNMPAGAITSTTPASTAVTGADESAFHATSLPSSVLVTGVNVLAVEVHQDSGASSDVSFVLELIGSTSPPSVSLTRGPYLQSGTPSSVVVRWRTSAASDSRVSYGFTHDVLGTNVDEGGLRMEHEVKLTGLQPATRYYYSVGSSTGALASGADQFFWTPPLTSTQASTRIWVLGDSGEADANAEAVRNAYDVYNGTRHTDLWLMLGDNAYENGTDAEYQAAVFNMYPRFLKQSVLWPTIGNHDSAGSPGPVSNLPYHQMFTLPTAGEAGGLASGTEDYYSFDHGNIHFICLDSMTVSRATTGPMLTWLAQDLASTTQDWIIAFWHHPPYSKGSHDSDVASELIEMRQNVLPILESYGVDLVLTGHSHSYERSFLLDGHYGASGTLTSAMKKNAGSGRADGTGAYAKATAGPSPNEGAVYAVAGSSGSVAAASLNHPAMYIGLAQLGSMVIDVSGNRLDATFLRETGAVADYFTILKGNVSDFGIAVSPGSVSVIQGGSGNTTATVTSLNGFGSAVSLSASGLPSGVTASFLPNPATPPANGNIPSTLTLTASSSAATGTFPVTVSGTSGSTTHTATLSLTVNPAGGGGDVTAVYDSVLRAPKCTTLGRSCDSATLLTGRRTLGPEVNQPNTINGTCADGTSGVFHADESNDRIKVSTIDGTTLAAGKTVRVDATVWAYSGFSSDRLDLYSAANANSPVWTLVATLAPSVGGSSVLSATYTLPSGALQAVRGRFRYQGSANPCGTGSYDDHDDLVFAVGVGTPDFSVSVSPTSVSLAQGASGNTTATVTSLNGFGSAVSLSASGLPSGVTASFLPNPATPPANGNIPSTLTLTASSSAATGTFPVTVSGTSGSTTHTATLSLTVTTPPQPDFGIAVSPGSVSVIQGGSGNTTATVTSLNGFGSAVSLSASGLPSGVTASFLPNPATPPANGNIPSTLTLTASSSAATGTFPVTVSGTSGSTTHTATLSLTVNPAGGGGDVTAVYDSVLRAPKCTTLGRSCDSATLLTGRRTLGPEVNQPNTINGTCADGTSGVFHADESNDRIKVSTIDGTTLAAGKTVRVDATVWAYSGFSSDRLDLYSAANANSPVWTLVATLAPSVGGSSVLSATYTLPSGALQAVRGRFRYQGSANPCGTGSYDDHDDLVFAVGVGTPDFSVSVSPTSVSLAQGASGNTTATVTSLNGFGSAVSLSASGLPSGVTASFLPNPATPPANGNIPSTLTLTASSSAATGTFPVTLSGTSGSLVHSTPLTLTVTTPPQPDFGIAVSPGSVSVIQGGSGNTTTTVTSLNGFGSAVSLSASGLPSGVTASFLPNPATPPANGNIPSTLTLTASSSAATGTFPVTVSGTSGSTTRTATLSLTVNPVGGGGDVIAVYDSVLRAPKCTALGRSCDSATLLTGRRTLGPEVNQPNTINGSCADGTSGAFHTDESNDRIKVSTIDGTNLAAGKTVRVDATVWAYSDFSSDRLDLYSAANADSPVWTLVATLAPSVGGSSVLSATYTLPSGALQAVRGRFRYQGSANPCGTGAYDDHDDLVFAVGPGTP